MYLYQVRDFVGTTVLYTFTPHDMELDAGVSRRSGSFAIYGVDGAINPFGSRAAPLAKKDFSWQFRILTGDQQSFDDARDALARAIFHGRPQTLVRRMDDNSLQFNIGYFVDAPTLAVVDSQFRHDFRIVWELDDPIWRSQYPPDARVWGVNPWVWGDPTVIWGDTSFALSSATTSHALAATGGAAGRPPTAPEHSARFLIVGPFGGANGFTVYNDSILVDSGAGMVPMQFTIHERVPAGVHYEIAPGAISVRRDGQKAYSHFSYPDGWQDEWMRIDPNITNNFRYVCNGASPVTGGRASVVYYLRYY